MYSLPTSATLAAFTMASAASTEPMSPTVSTIPSASCDIGLPLRSRKTLAHTAAPGLPDRARSCTISDEARLKPTEDETPSGASLARYARFETRNVVDDIAVSPAPAASERRPACGVPDGG